MGIKDENIQRSIVITKELSDKINQEAKDTYTSFTSVVKKILTKYFEDK